MISSVNRVQFNLMSLMLFIFIIVDLATFLPLICMNPEILDNLIRNDPDRVRKLAAMFGFTDLPEPLVPGSIDLTPVCGKDGQPASGGIFGLPDLFEG